MGALIDSSVFIAIERGKLDRDVLVNASVGPVAIAAITASELLHGVHRTATDAQRATRSAFVESILGTIPILSFDVAIARVHARLVADLARAGSRVGTHDEQIAATALAFGLDIATRDTRSFPRIAGLTVHLW